MTIVWEDTWHVVKTTPVVDTDPPPKGTAGDVQILADDSTVPNAERSYSATLHGAYAESVFEDLNVWTMTNETEFF